MTRKLIVVCMALLISSPFAPIASSQLERSVDQQNSDAPTKQAARSRFLFFHLNAPESTGGPFNVEFRISVDDLPYLVERFVISPDEARLSPALEILAREPDHLENLYRLARKEKRQVKVIVRVNNETLRTFSFHELRKYNRELKTEPGFLPLAFDSRVIVLRRFRDEKKDSLRLAGDCEVQCENEYAECAQMECGDPSSLCSPCLEARSRCYDACPPPGPCSGTCPQPETCSSTYEIIGATWLGSLCLTNAFQENKIFDWYSVRYKKTTTCRTEDPCRCTQTTRTSYEYIDRWCDVETWSSCDYSQGYPFTCSF
jgi:hypothetical protein